ncbi:MAG TPA: trehalose-6-phosphate synthase, partial [Syntrophorhabdaceae bacterium]|nr:trehalose-6-phosphate synthase [Syntrophorhabdaceae bacterium]
FIQVDGENTYVSVTPITDNDTDIIGALAIFNDTSYFDARLGEILKDNITRFFIVSILVALSTVIVVRWSVTGPIANLAESLRKMRLNVTGGNIEPPIPERGNVLEPIISEVASLAKSLSAKEETRVSPQKGPFWTKTSLKEYMTNELNGKRLFLVSNREPYIHEKESDAVRYIVPAGGLVTAIDPVMKACDGVWIAHGSGNADKETADAFGRVPVPPENPMYTLRRVWLSKQQEAGYYYGFSNEGLWPLCHITHTRPVFRLDDWIQYQEVNQVFADSLLEEIGDEPSPLVLVQDYHLALLPFLIREKKPDAKIALFWHIPWPNPESFGICPWRREILIGMLGADLLGFHIQFFCNNFLDTVDRFMESQIDWENFAIGRAGRSTLVKPFPIGIGLNGDNTAQTTDTRESSRRDIAKSIGVKTEFIGVGVDRIDYTKGIPERFSAIDRFF